MDGDIFIYSTESSNAELSEQKSLKIFFRKCMSLCTAYILCNYRVTSRIRNVNGSANMFDVYSVVLSVCGLFLYRKCRELGSILCRTFATML